jgi:hypothetical protein
LVGICYFGRCNTFCHCGLAKDRWKRTLVVDKVSGIQYNCFTADSNTDDSNRGNFLRNFMFSEVVGRLAYVALGIVIGINLFLFFGVI